MRRTVVDARPGVPGVDLVGGEGGTGAGGADLVEGQRAPGRGLRQARPALAAQCARSVGRHDVDGVLTGARRPGPHAHPHVETVRSAHRRTQPHDPVEPHVGRALGAQGPADGLARHLQLGGSGEYPASLDDVVAQEGLVPVERRRVQELVTARLAPVHQGVTATGVRGRGGFHSGSAAHPVALPGERVGRQARPPRGGRGGGRRRPVDGLPTDPPRQEPFGVVRHRWTRGRRVPAGAGARRAPGDRTAVPPLRRALDEGGQPAPEVVGGTDPRGDPLLHRVTSHPQGVGDVRQFPPVGTVLVQVPHQSACLFAQPLVRPRGQDDRLRDRLHVGAPLAWRPRLVLLEDDVGVDPAEPEGADTGAPRDLPALHVARTVPRPPLPNDPEGPVPELEVGVELLGVQALDEGPVPHLQDRLDHPGHARGQLQVADVALDRPQPAARRGLRARGHLLTERREGGPEGVEFDGVTEFGPGSVRLDVGHGAWIDPGLPVGRPQQFGLRDGVGRRQRMGTPSVVLGAAPDHRVDVVAVALGLVERLEDQQAHALSAHVAVGVGGEGLTAAVLAEHPRAAVADVEVGADHGVDAAHERHAAPALAEQLDTAVDRHQRTRTGGLDRLAGPVQVQEVAQPVGTDRTGHPGGRVGVLPLPLAQDQFAVAARRGADQHRRVTPRQARRRVSRVLQRLPRVGEQQTLLRVHDGRLPGGDAEEQRVEAVHVVEEAAPPHGAPARRCVGVRVHRTPVPALGGDLRDAVPALAEVVPELGEVAGPRKAAAHPDDGDGGRPGRLRAPGGNGGFRCGSWGGDGDRDRFGRPGRSAPGGWGEAPAVGVDQVGRHAREGPVLEEDRGRQLQAVLVVEAVGQGGEADGVEPELPQFLVRVEFPRGYPELLAHMGDQRLQRARAGIGVLGAAGGVGLPRVRDVFVRLRAQPRRQALQQEFPVARQDEGLSATAGGQGPERPQAVLGTHRRHTEAAQSGQPGLVDPHSALGPERPVDRQGPPRPQAPGDEPVPVARVGVHERVGRRVVRLSEAAEYGGVGGEGDQVVERLVPGRLVQVEESGDLGRQHTVDVLVRLGADEPVTDLPGGVDDAVDRAVPPYDLGDEVLDRAPVGHVDPVVLDREPRPFEGGDAPTPLGVRSGAARQHDRSLTQAVRHLLGEHEAEAAEAAGDHVDAAVTPGSGGRLLRPPLHLHETPDLVTAGDAAHIGLRGITAERAYGLGQRVGGGVVEVLDALCAQSRVLQFGRSEQARHTGEGGGRRDPVTQDDDLDQGGAPACGALPHRVQKGPGQPWETGVRLTGVEDPEPHPHGKESPEGVLGRAVETPDHPHVVTGRVGRRAPRAGTLGRRVAPGGLQPQELTAVRLAGAVFRSTAVRAAVTPRRARVGDPVGLPGERVGRQCDPFGASLVEQTVVGERASSRELFGEGAEDRRVDLLAAVRRSRGADRHRGVGPAVPRPDGGHVASVQPVAQFECRPLRRSRHQCQAVAEVLAPHEQRVADAAQALPRVGLQVGEQLLRLLPEALGGPARQHDQPRAGRPGGCDDGGGLRQHQVGVGPAVAEGADRRHPRLPPRRPGPRTVVHVERGVRQVDVVVGPLMVDRGRQDAVFECQHGLDRSGDPGRARRVADVALHRAQRAVPPAVRVRTEAPDETVDLHGVPEFGAGAVRLHQLDVVRVQAEGLVHAAQQRGLGLGVGGGDAVGPAVLVDPPPPDDGVDPVTVGLGVGQALQQQHAHALRRDEAVGALVEGEAPSVRGQCPQLAHRHVDAGAGDHPHPARQRRVAAAEDQAVAGVGDGHERRRAGGVDGEAGTLEVEYVGDPTGEDRAVGAQVLVGAQVGLVGPSPVAVDGGAHEDTAPAPRERLGTVARLLDAAPALLEEDALLRVHVLRLVGRYTEEEGIEQVRVLQDPHPPAVAASGGAGPFVVVVAHRPA